MCCCYIKIWNLLMIADSPFFEFYRVVPHDPVKFIGELCYNAIVEEVGLTNLLEYVNL